MVLDKHHHPRESRSRGTLKDSNNEYSTAKLDLAKNVTKARSGRTFEKSGTEHKQKKCSAQSHQIRETWYS